MRVIFAGTPEFACVALRQLCGAGFEVALVLTQPDRPAGRGMQLHPSPVKAFAQQQGIPVAQPRSLRLDGKYPDDARSAQQAIAAARADVMVVAAYGLILTQWVLDAMRQPGATVPTGLGCLNIHASLLPRWRGAAPIHRAIEAGDTRTGVAIMQMDAGLDTGDILLEQELAINQHGPDADTTGSLHDRLAALGAGLLLQALRLASHGLLQPRAQAVDGVTYAHKVEKAQARIDWSGDAALLERRIRAFNPAPGAWTESGSEVLKLWRAGLAQAPAGEGAPAGTVVRADQGGITVACGQGAVTLLEVQRAGGKRMDAAAFARGAGVRPGMALGALPAGA